jgi:maltooligosyltrehalose trehalohydrolase
VNVVLDADGTVYPMQALDDGWFERVQPGLAAGARYAFEVDGLRVPDPASRCNPDDVHGPSMVIDPGAYEWQDGDWRGRRWEEAVIYELHVGTFTHEGTFDAAFGRLDDLRDLGVTAIELMPIADFPAATAGATTEC